VSLQTVKTIAEVRDRLDGPRRNNRTIGLVPTMGALHAGHASLMERARSECGTVAVSIFVNPTQFGPHEDYLRYPRPLDADLALCERLGTDLVFLPEVAEMYRAQPQTFVEVPLLGDHLCGPFRPGHFRGVSTVVLKLLNIFQPDKAYFGEKDYQQLSIIRRMTEDLNLPVAIVPVPIFREPDGLALSSRNVYLQPGERRAAPVLFRALEASRQQIEQGEKDPRAVKESAARLLAAEPLVRPEYFEIVDAASVQPVAEIVGALRIAGAIWIGRTRLIDNVGVVAG
jgi:pantoate--beta-alanine ligase